MRCGIATPKLQNEATGSGYEGCAASSIGTRKLQNEATGSGYEGCAASSIGTRKLQNEATGSGYAGSAASSIDTRKLQNEATGSECAVCAASITHDGRSYDYSGLKRKSNAGKAVTRVTRVTRLVDASGVCVAHRLRLGLSRLPELTRDQGPRTRDQGLLFGHHEVMTGTVALFHPNAIVDGARVGSRLAGWLRPV